jgi:hypothetical protein
LYSSVRTEGRRYTPAINPDDYDNDTDYLNAVPGLMEAIDAEFDSPAAEDVPVEEIWPDVFD